MQRGGKNLSNSYSQEEKVFTYCVQNDRFKGYLEKNRESLEERGNLKSKKKCKAMKNSREKIYMFKYCLMEVLEYHRK